MRPPDRVRVTTFVAVSPDQAFELFTAEIDRWWRRGIAYRVGGRGGTLRFEEVAGERRLVELDDDGHQRHQFGRVLAWEPGARLLLEWRGSNFAPGERTEVEVRFEPLGEGTRVTLEHRGFASLRPDHPVRHGLEGQAFTDTIGRWWGDLATAYRAYVAGTSSLCPVTGQPS